MKKIYLGILLGCLLIILQNANAIAQNKPVFSIPFTLIDNRPFIEVKIKQHTFHFILDCGADYGLDANTAKILRKEPGKTRMMGGGAGANKVSVWRALVDTTQIGTVKVLKTNYLVIDMSEIKNKLHLPYLDGVIGYHFMKDYAVQFDYPKRVINFYKSYSASSPIPFILYDGSVPQFKAAIDGKNAIVIVDTGDRTSFSLFNHFATITGLINHYKLSDTLITGYGLGGAIYARRFILNHLQIGKTDLKNVPSRMPTLKTGFFADTHIDGSVGGGVLKQFKFTIDYKKQDLYFE